jgi:acyl carrier protein
LVAWIVPKNKVGHTQDDNSTVPQKLPEIKEETKISKLEFRLSQHGLRKFSIDNKVIDLEHPESLNERKRTYNWAKSYRSFHHEILEKELFEQWLFGSSNENINNNVDGDNSFSLLSLGRCLSVFAQCKVPENPFPRYLYPSAGGLYPVQIYLYFNKAYKNIEPYQPYYYDPESHKLKHIPSKSKANVFEKGENSLFSLYFVGKKSAIFPIYREMSKDFCILEAGYMQGILYPSLASSKWKASSDANFQEKKELPTMLGLDKEDLIITRLIVEKEKSVNQLKTTPKGQDDEIINIYFYIKSNEVLGLNQGLYEFNPLTKKLSMISKTFSVSEEDYLGENKLLFQDASFCVFFLEKNQEVAKPLYQDDTSLMRAGVLSQTLKMSALSHNIGLCPIGIMDSDLERRLQKIIGGGKLIHSLIGGRITFNQMEDSLSSEPRKDQPFEANSLRQYLSTKVPEYMVPSAIFTIEKLPLTTNGKIDRQALIEFTKNQGHKNDKVKQEPKTEIEKTLAQIWGEALQIQTVGINEDFFEVGGDSLLMARIILKIRKTFDVNISIRQMLMNPTIKDFSSFLEGSFKISSALRETPKDDAKLFKDLIPNMASTFVGSSSTPSSLLITGANGFLGIHLLSDLYQRTQSKLYCLMRAKDIQDAQLILKKSFEKYSLPDLSRDNRVIPIIGDLSKPQLGLEKQQFEFISKIDLIYHVGAFVHHIYDYKKLRPTNVLGTL